MKRFNLRRLLAISLLTVLLTVGAFRLALHWRVQQELLMPGHEGIPAEAIRVQPGFKVQLLHSATLAEGTWIAMTRDPEGRLIIAPDAGKLLRVTLARGKVAKIERLGQPIVGAMGLLYAGGRLFLDGAGPQGWGLYSEKVNTETLEGPELICPLANSMPEHGGHQVTLGPDNKLYVVCGNYTSLPPGLSDESPFAHDVGDQLLPFEFDPHGFEINLNPTAGFIIRLDLDGTHRQLFAAGLRNIYALAFNPDGEMFGVDNDAEMDMGTAWYRPVRFLHCVSGGDYGYRQGTGKMPGHDEDILPAAFNLGLGAPSGVKFGTQSNFPKPYRNACFVQDWAFGRLLAVHLIPQGATYDAGVETVLRGSPLNMTALEFGLDGDLYFITGGQGRPAGLYRLTYDGLKAKEDSVTRPPSPNDVAAEAARSLRHQLESFQGRRDPRAPEVVWPSLGSADRWIRYAARVALEFQDVAWWKDRALAETNVEGGLTALLALARCGGAATQDGLLRALDKFPFSGLTQEQTLLKLRVLELSFIRQGHPTNAMIGHEVEILDPLYPSTDRDVNQELCQLLLYLQAPDAVAKTVALLAKAPTLEEQTYYVMRLRNITNGWTLELRQNYFGWFQRKREQVRHRPEIAQYFRDVDLEYSDGESLQIYLDSFRDEAAALLSAGERKALAAYLPKPRETPPAPRLRKFVKQWRMADLEPHLAMLQRSRSRARGRALFGALECALCHRFANQGGSVGPDLTALGSRSTPRDILESILEPSKVLPEQFQNTALTLRDGDVLTGRVVSENQQELVFMTDLVRRTKVNISREDVLSRRASKISPMPEELLNSLTEDEIWDLIAFLKSGGNHPSDAALK